MDRAIATVFTTFPRRIEFPFTWNKQFKEEINFENCRVTFVMSFDFQITFIFSGNANPRGKVTFKEQISFHHDPGFGLWTNVR